MSDLHLLLPLTGAFLFVCGLLFTKQASGKNVNPWTVTFLSNICASILFSSLWFLGGPGQPWYMLWQPFIIASLYVLGIVFTFNAIERGDVSVATPVFGIKVLIVGLFVTFLSGHSLPAMVWVSAAIAVIGIVMIQWTGSGHPKHILLTICLAVLAATSFATFDVLVQKWAPAWGPGRFLPYVYWMVGLYSIIFIPFVQFDKIFDREIRTPLFIGAFLIGFQAMFIVFTLSVFGDATRVNVMYATRGIWSVVLAWIVAKRWGGSESSVPYRWMMIRLFGAILLTGAVILAILGGGERISNSEPDQQKPTSESDT